MSARLFPVLENGRVRGAGARDRSLVDCSELLGMLAQGTQLARVSQAAIAERLGCCQNTVQNLLDRLRQLGFIVATVACYGRDGGREENIYCLVGKLAAEQLVERAQQLAQQTVERVKNVYRQVAVVTADIASRVLHPSGYVRSVLQRCPHHEAPPDHACKGCAECVS